jgi:hypothetical protein
LSTSAKSLKICDFFLFLGDMCNTRWSRMSHCRLTWRRSGQQQKSEQFYNFLFFKFTFFGHYLALKCFKAFFHHFQILHWSLVSILMLLLVNEVTKVLLMTKPNWSKLKLHNATPLHPLWLILFWSQIMQNRPFKGF